MKKNAYLKHLLFVSWNHFNESSFSFHLNFEINKQTHPDFNFGTLRTMFSTTDDNFELTVELEKELKDFVKNFKNLSRKQQIFNQKQIQKHLISFFKDYLRE